MSGSKGSASYSTPTGRAWRGPARPAKKPKVGPHNQCSDPKCKHFRSDHTCVDGKRVGPCGVEGCQCEGMVW